MTANTGVRGRENMRGGGKELFLQALKTHGKLSPPFILKNTHPEWHQILKFVEGRLSPTQVIIRLVKERKKSNMTLYLSFIILKVATLEPTAFMMLQTSCSLLHPYWKQDGQLLS